MHEMWDPIHGFVHFTNHERNVINSRPFQRLRHIRQLGMSHYVYPSANHTRFEHSIGVMELATRVFNNVASRVPEALVQLLPEFDKNNRSHWRHTLRMAALCHDLGHLPFSHAGEEQLFPNDWSHERMTVELIRGMTDLWDVVPEGDDRPLDAEEIAKVAVGQDDYPDGTLTDGEAVLSEIITGNYFGVDRIDYLLRDSLHVGMASGTFDHQRLIETLRVLPEPPDRPQADKPLTPSLGVETGGLSAAEALLTARYFMFKQVYLHPVRRIYDIHLQEFTAELVTGGFPVEPERFVECTDETIMKAMLESAYGESGDGRELARRVVCREHFHLAYRPTPADRDAALSPAQDIYDGLSHEFGDEDTIRGDFPRRERRKKRTDMEASYTSFSVWDRQEEQVQSSAAVSELTEHFARRGKLEPEFVFVRRDRLADAQRWIEEKRERAFGGEWREDSDEPT